MKHWNEMKWLPIERIRTLAAALAWFPCVAMAQPQGQLVDGIIAVVGREIVLYSEIAGRTEQARGAGLEVDAALICEELEEMLFEKLLLDQARLDSVTVDEGQVQGELERRIRYFVMQLGSQEKLEEFYGKSITEIKDDFHDQVRDQLLVQTMRQQVTGGIAVTPREVERFFRSIPEDSLPFINAQVELAHILREPKPSEAETRRTRRRIEEFRESVVRGEKDFCTIAMLYSEDPGSARDCGELGLVPRGVMVPEFDAVAMSLKEGEVSLVFETEFGFHFMQLVERRGEQYNARHVLLKPQVTNEDMLRERRFLDSLAVAIRDGLISFGDAAAAHSDDEDSRSTNGSLIEPNTNSVRWAIGDLDQQTFFVVDKLAPEAISEPVVLTAPDGSKSLRLIKLLRRTDPHRANLKDDYQLLQQAAESKQRAAAVDNWVKDKLQWTHVRVDTGYATCPFLTDWTFTTTR